VFRHCEGKDSSETIRYCIACISIQVKSAVRKLREGKDHDCDLFMSDVSAQYKPCVAHPAKCTTSFAEFKCFDYTTPFANN